MMSELSAARARLRQAALAARAALSLAFRQEAGERIADHFLALPEVRLARVIALYLSLPPEVPTAPLLHRLRQLPNPPLLAAPVILGESRMAMYPLPEDLSALERGPFGIPQPPTAGIAPLPPESLEVVAVPVVAFDHAGHRLGYGAGYYDRYLATCKGRPLLVGLAFSVQVLPSIPAAPHDIAIDVVVTETGIMRSLEAKA